MELTPVQAISPDRRPYSILGQRFMTTRMPFSSSRAAVSSWRTVSCIHTTLGSVSIARISSATPGTAADARKMSTMSTGCGRSASAAKTGRPRISLPAWPGLIGKTS